MSEVETVLDLPIEQQRELAKLEGLSHVAWVENTKKELAEDDAFRARLDANKGVRPPGWTDADTERFQRKLDSATH